VNRAVAVASSRRVASALPLWQELADSYPEEQGFRLQVAACLLRLGRWAKCHDALDQVSGGLRQSPHAQLLAAGLALGEGRVGHALAIAREVGAAPLDDAALYNQLGQLFIDTSAWSEAESAFRASLATVAENPVALDGLAQLSRRQGDFAAAVEHALGAVGLRHFFPAAHFHLAEALVGLDRGAEAIVAYETALKMGFEPRAAHACLAELYRLRNPAKAKHHENCSLSTS
jgi:tetratricopeptide (TPR) repeat protein